MNFLAFDLGATSGRAILGCINGGRLDSEEIYRFPNAVKEDGGKYYWDIYSLFGHFKAALKELTPGEWTSGASALTVQSWVFPVLIATPIQMVFLRRCSGSFQRKSFTE